ncbi:unnamed protein product [Eruca vesicaria subsp. sativa]|uniref:Uncharacterized protein n=1 Tax=Eruca vesicaria subsp. sativa TaxID=29727 RepID=A0ABC8J9P4_ERUVS|nr:unnamed protein product [Eruca vesicaria subsp. sativa]
MERLILMHNKSGASPHEVVLSVPPSLLASPIHVAGRERGRIDRFRRPVSSKPGNYKFLLEEDDFLPMDYDAVWSEMEECKRLGIAKCIGGIVLTAYSVLGSRGAFWGTHKIMESDVLTEIADAKGKTVAQGKKGVWIKLPRQLISLAETAVECSLNKRRQDDFAV